MQPSRLSETLGALGKPSGALIVPERERERERASGALSFTGEVLLGFQHFHAHKVPVSSHVLMYWSLLSTHVDQPSRVYVLGW